MKNEKFSKKLIYAKKIQILSNSASILQTLNMAWSFCHHGFDVDVVASISLKKKEIIKTIIRNYKLDAIKIPFFHCLRSKNKGLYGIFFRYNIAKFWIDREPKVFYARDIKESLYIMFLKKMIKRNHLFVYEMHDSIYLEYYCLNNIYDENRRKNELEVLSGADGIVYTGPYLKKIVEDLYKPVAPSLVAPPGYNPAIFKKIGKKTRSSSFIELAYFGTLFPNKGVDVFLDALSMLPSNYLGRIVGGNPAARLDELKKKIGDKGLEGRINFMGQVPPLDVPSALDGVDAIVIPFQSESEFLSPIKLYESLALGLPIIATPMPAIVRLSKEIRTIVLASGRSDVEISECISELFADKDRIALLQDWAQKRECVQTWDDRAGCILNFIESIA